jgi:single-stranded-DNA-specific exonuclease
MDKGDEDVERLVSSLGVHPVTARILVNRGIRGVEEARVFLNPKLQFLPHPSLLPDIDEACRRIAKAILSGEKIAVFGDFDTDGITATALLVRFFRGLGVEVIHYIPNRLSEGYGLNCDAISRLAREGVNLIITVDNGVSARDEIDFASSLGVDVVISDHHEVAGELPRACAVVDPKRDANSPLSELAGVGVAFYLAAALKSWLEGMGYNKAKGIDLKRFLDLVTVGTVADVSPLLGANRILVSHGIRLMKGSPSPWVEAIMKTAGISGEEMDTDVIAFRIAPRINASGRLGRHGVGLDILLADDLDRAISLSSDLEEMNRERQLLEKRVVDDVEAMLEKDGAIKCIVASSCEWHPGVIGSAASRLSEKYLVPTVIISIDGDVGRGSVRGVGGFDVIEALHSLKGFLLDYGGHKGAAGFDIRADLVESFKSALERYVEEHFVGGVDTSPFVVDAEIEIGDISTKLISELQALSPYGEGNPPPCLLVGPCTAKDVKRVGNNHLKVTLLEDGISIDAIGFGLGSLNIAEGRRYRFAGVPEANVWNNTSRLQIKFLDVVEVV